MLIAAAAVSIVWAAVQRFAHPQPLESLGWGVTLSVASSAINGLLAWRMMAGARQHRSIVLEADARHLMTDVWTSAGVVAGLLLVQLTGWLWLDPLLAIGVALNILREGGQLAWRSVEGLMDSAVEPEIRAQIDATLASFDHASIRFDHVVTRRAGQRRFIDLHMHVPADWTLGRAAALRADVEQSLMHDVPGLRASIQLLPTNVEAQSAVGLAP
jgi:cation diffusion facilitator family transporter